MGDPSKLRFVPKSSAAVPIDWSKIPEKSKQYFIKYWTFDWETKTKRPLPETIGDLANFFNGGKFFGYMTPELCQLLLDISEFGLKEEKSDGHRSPVGPRFYMKYLSEVWFVLFTPGEKGGVCGYSDKLPFPDFEDEEEGEDEDHDEDQDRDEEEDEGEGREAIVEAKTDRELAEIFDEKLVDEFSRWGIIRALASKRLAGWEAETLESNLETAQFSSAILSLPLHHPARESFMRDFFASLARR
ncbi:hypothetical protein BYT27DRAFT_7200306 [Phlegmacium glaucopus]|nr:hypothetical protein BYT27DRAFT_7200306 [Phlegmacium glaucopus]